MAKVNRLTQTKKGHVDHSSFQSDFPPEVCRVDRSRRCRESRPFMSDVHPKEEPVAEPEPKSFWRSVAQSLRAGHHDYTAERLNRAVFLLAVPMVLEMVMESLFAVSDVFWVSRLGKEA